MANSQSRGIAPGLFFFFPGFLLLLISCSRPWTEKDKSEFLSGCLHGAAASMGSEKGKAYCQCMLGKVVARYPNARDARYLSSDTAMRGLGRDCLHQAGADSLVRP